jgi:hypothetical protein
MTDQEKLAEQQRAFIEEHKGADSFSHDSDGDVASIMHIPHAKSAMGSARIRYSN